MSYRIAQLTPADVPALKALLKVFGEAFQDTDSYGRAVPSDAYLQSVLARPHFIVLIATNDNDVIGGLAAYELEKFEQDRREIYIYDLAVSEQHRRKGLATQLIGELRRIATRRKAYVIFVQADQDDIPAIRLYESLGTREEVLHFDIAVPL
ncbi:MAG TPA: AAC(3)-I family aminoglycoside N-acetyltransferase [Bryobacteraceae bacterium]|jgi:aminoglycoside 3-N-acetyltransferase I